MNQFICAACGYLTQQCKCDHSTSGEPFETELAFRQKVIAKLDAIESKLDQLIESHGHATLEKLKEYEVNTVIGDFDDV